MRVSARGAKAVVTAGLVSALVFGGIAPATPAIAAGTASVTVTSGSEAYKVTGDYKVYQLFTGTFFKDSAGKNHMGDVDANPDYKSAVVNALTAVNADFSLTTSISDDRQAIQITDAIAKLSSVDAQKFANKLAGELSTVTTGVQTVTATDNKLELTGLDTGYYLIVGNDGEGAVTSAIVVPVDGAVTATTKASTPTITKQVKMGTDPDNYFADFTDGGLVEKDKLDSITYKLVGTVSSNIEDFTAYRYEFEDTLPGSITKTSTEGWNVTVQATIDEDTKDVAGFTASNNGNKVTWSNDDLLQSLKAAGFTKDFGDAQITLTYTPDFTPKEFVDALQSSIDDSDTVAHATNSAKLIYSNNPYGDQTGKANSAASTAKVYSYQLDVTSVGDGIDIAGAKFTLKLGDKVIHENIKVDEQGHLSMTGLDSGVEYTLVESSVPAGTKSIDPIKFTIDATANATKVSKVVANETADPSDAATFGDDNDADNVVHVTVKSLKGADLPLTGQQGIVAGVAVGGIVLTASLVAVVRNRKREE